MACEHDYEPNEVCFRCCREAYREKWLRGSRPTFYVFALMRDRLYGGPEEGGWFWDRDEVVEYRQVRSAREGLAVARELRAKYESDRFGRYSCAGGTDYEIRVVPFSCQMETFNRTEKPSYC